MANPPKHAERESGHDASRVAGSAGGKPRHGAPSLAVLVPYRDRAEQLALFVPHIHQHLTAQGERGAAKEQRAALSAGP